MKMCSFQDPPRLRNFTSKRFNLNSMLISPRRDAPPEGTRGTFRILDEEVGVGSSESSNSNGNGNQSGRNKPRPLSQEVCFLFDMIPSDGHNDVLILFVLFPAGTAFVAVVTLRDVSTGPAQSAH